MAHDTILTELLHSLRIEPHAGAAFIKPAWSQISVLSR